jgi:hypothetical protein
MAQPAFPQPPSPPPHFGPPAGQNNPDSDKVVRFMQNVWFAYKLVAANTPSATVLNRAGFHILGFMNDVRWLEQHGWLTPPQAMQFAAFAPIWNTGKGQWAAIVNALAPLYAIAMSLQPY